MIRAWLRVACTLSLGACASQSSSSSAAFSQRWQNDAGRSIARLEESLRNQPHVANAALAVGVNDVGLVAASLDRSSRWSHAGHFDVMPSIAGALVIVSEGDQIAALDAKSGARVWSLSRHGRALRGAANDGNATALVLSEPGTSQFLAISASGAVLSSIETETQLGSPAARSGIAFVPWGDQFVSAIEMASGSEIARALVREKVSRALNFEGEIYFGEGTLVHLDQKLRFADTNQATRVALPKLSLPGNPGWLGSGYETPSTADNARTKIRIYASPVLSSTGLHFGGIVASYFRVAFGLDPERGSLRWVRTLPNDVVGGAASSSGFALCDKTGTVWLLDTAGNAAGQVDLGQKIRICALDAGTFSFPKAKSDGDLADQISQALEVLEPDMAAAQHFLLDALGKQTKPSVTKTLIDLSSSARMPPEQREEARALLAKRTTGTEYMLTALERHYDFVSGVLLPPPVGPLADALAAAGEARAAPLLAKHLNDPANSAEDVEHAARALATLATAAEYPDLRTFFALYRATADDEALVRAVTAVASALLRIGGDPGRELVERALGDALTQRDVRSALASLVAKEQSRAPEAASPKPK